MTKQSDDRGLSQAAAALALRLRELLAPIGASAITLSRDEAVLALGIVEGFALHVNEDAHVNPIGRSK